MTNFQRYTYKSTAGTLLRGMTLTTLVATTLSVAFPAQATDKGATHAPMAAAHAVAPGSKMTPAQQKQFEAFKKARNEMMQASGQLNKIQNAAFKAHPELKKRQKTFVDLLSKTMKKNGYDAKKEIAELKSLRSKLQDKKTPQAKERKLASLYQAKVIKLKKAQGTALQDKKVQEAKQSLQNAVITAMRKQDPDTDKLIAMVQSKQKEMLKIRQSVLAHKQHSSNTDHAASHSPTKSN